MFNIKMLNNISNIAFSELPKEKFSLSKDHDNYEGVLVRSYDMHSLSMPESLLAIARAGAGVNNIPISKCTDKGIAVFNTPGANANAVSELVMAGLLLCSRDIVGGISWVKTLDNESDVARLVEKNKSQFAGPELRGKTLGVIGLGAIGAQVANLAAVGFGMKVLGHDPFMSIENAWTLSRRVSPCYDMDMLLQEADYLTIHVPLNADTKEMINAEFFDKMKEGACLLNFSRCDLVESQACIKALENKKLKKYVTDFPKEKYLNVENIIAIPHLGASTPESEDNCAIMAAQQLRDYLLFGNIHNSVNMPELSLNNIEGFRIQLIHENIPKMVNMISSIISREHININNMINRSKEKVAITVMDLDKALEARLLTELKQIKGVSKVRSLE